MGNSNGYRPAIVLKTGSSKFYLNSEGVDRLPGRGAPQQPPQQPAALTQLTQVQQVALMRRILRKSNNSLEVLKLSGEPLVAGWEERAYKQLRKLVHPDKWRQHGGELLDLATKAFQEVQDARDRATGNENAFVPDETDQEAVNAQREAEAQRLAAEAEAEDDGPVFTSLGAPEASSSSAPGFGSLGDDSAPPAFRSLGASDEYRGLGDDSPAAPPPPARSGSSARSKRELLLQRARQESHDLRAYEAALEAAQKA